MIRGFVTGVIWGGVVAATGLAVVSQVAPMPEQDMAAGAPAEPATPPQVDAVDAPEGIDPPAEPVAEPAPAGPVPQDAAEPEAGETAATVTAEPAPEAAPEAPPTEPMQPEILQKGPVSSEEENVAAPPATEAEAAPAPAPIPEATAPVSDLPPAAAPAPEGMAAPQPVPPGNLADAAPDAGVPPVVPEADGTIPEAMAEAVPGLVEPPLAAVPAGEDAPAPTEAPPAPEEALLQPAPVEEAAPAPALIVPDAPLPTVPETGASGDIALAVPGVRTDRLPRIGDDAEAETEGMAPDAAPDAGLAEVPPEVLMGTTPLELFRREFDNPEAKPIFGLILIDEGLPAAERETLAALPFPVTFALDPLAPHSADAARVYRAAGQEVAMVANGIPEGATPGDLEQTFQALDMAMPEAVAVLDRVEGGFQDSLDLARQAVPIVAEQGRGVVTYDRGLNSADQVARREGVPRATIFRVLDAEGESIPKMRNYLDRAAFKAAQEGRVLVIGRARAETVAAILEWTVEGRAASVALAPLSAVLEMPPTP